MKFNVKADEQNKTENLAGGEAYQESPKLEFISMALTSFIQDQYYRSEQETVERLVNLINSISDKEFLAKTALYGRTKFGMRSVSHIIAAEIAKTAKEKPWTKRFFDKIVYRPDDMTEILAYYLNEYGKPIPNAVKKGFASALSRFDEYQISKYKQSKSKVSLVDIANLVHPHPTPAISGLVNGNLKPPETWETQLTQAGQMAESEEQKAELKSKVWTNLISEKKIGYFALLRNLRNIAEQSPQIIDEAAEMLTDQKLIKKSLVLPFRYMTAFNEIERLPSDHSRNILVALSKAIDLSLSNVPKLDGRTLVALDTSGSMEGRPIEIGSLFAAVLIKSNDADCILFSDDAFYFNYNPLDSTPTIANTIKRKAKMAGTNFHSIFQTASKPYDRIIILSDMQAWMGYNTPKRPFSAYKSRTNCDPLIYSFDLQGYGTLQFPETNVCCLAGFSEKIFDVMKLIETDKKALIKTIENVEI